MLLGWRFRIGCLLLFLFVIVFFLLHRPVVFFLLHHPIIFFCGLSPSRRIQPIYSSWRVCACVRVSCYPMDSLTPRAYVPLHRWGRLRKKAYNSIAWRSASIIRCSLLFFSSFHSSSMTSLAKSVATLHAFSDASICRTWFSGVIAVTSILSSFRLCVLNLGHVKNTFLASSSSWHVGHSGESLCLYLYKYFRKHPCPVSICVR